MLMRQLLLTGVAAGSYALFPSTMGKLKYRLHQNGGREDIYLTFDDGPTENCTPGLLELLSCWKIPATFFVVASAAQSHPEIIRRMKTEGHQIGFHSDRHRSAYLMSPRQTKKDFIRGLETMERLGVIPRLFRPPWGVVNLSSIHEVRRRELTPVLWTVMAQDWKREITTEEMTCRLRARVRPGSVICLHDGGAAANKPERVIQALSVLIPEWIDKGYRFRRMEP